VKPRYAGFASGADYRGVDLPVTCNELDPVDFSEIVRDLDALGA
jgi:hypothetical protein